MGKKNAPRKRSGNYPYSPVSFIQNGVKYKAGQKPARVCPAPAAAPKPLSPLERHLAESLHATADHKQQLLDDLAPLSGRPAGSTSDSTDYIRKLRANNPALHWKELLKLADPEKLGSMSEGRFRNIAGGARRK